MRKLVNNYTHFIQKSQSFFYFNLIQTPYKFWINYMILDITLQKHGYYKDKFKSHFFRVTVLDATPIPGHATCSQYEACLTKHK